MTFFVPPERCFATDSERRAEHLRRDADAGADAGRHPEGCQPRLPRVRATPPVDHGFQGPRGPQARSLSPAAHAWLAKMPPRYQPLAIARRHPHIVNQLEALWDSPARLSSYLRDLLRSHRVQRTGFSFDVLTEIADLQALNLQHQRLSRH